MSLRTPLGKVRGLGTAKEGTHHWWAQRLTAVVLIPLSFWFIFSLTCMTTMEYANVIEWMKSPVIATLLILFVFSLYYHALLGVQVVIEDYVHCEALKISSLILLKIVCWFAAIVSVLAILKVFLEI